MSETPVAFARSYMRGLETAIAFAGEKPAFLVQFVGAEVMAVSTVAVQGRAVVSVVSSSDCERTDSGTMVPKPMMVAVVHAVRS